MRSPEDSQARGGSGEAATATAAPPVSPPGPDAAEANEPAVETRRAESHPGANSWLARLIRRLTGGSEEDFVLQIVQPSLVGLIDGTVSTLAPIFAAAVSTNSRTALLVGIATALGAGVSMGMSEALSDTGEITNRGSALVRGIITGGATALGGIFHSLPFLIGNVNRALVVAGIVVGIELFVIAWVRYKFLHVSLRSSLIVVTLGGAIVLGIGVLVGSS
ncbi:MAG: erythrin-vacuolar iron transport family protein [Solirubrobacteraceae bacterium]|nr:erythrin-vacuolar iron transport family protein [Solirubrobacteraceae bacterium]